MKVLLSNLAIIAARNSPLSGNFFYTSFDYDGRVESGMHSVAVSING